MDDRERQPFGAYLDRTCEGIPRREGKTKAVSHDRQQETDEAKAQWFQSLTLEERMDYLCMMTDLIFENSKEKIMKAKNAEPTNGRVCILTAP